jgi:hypothetical protein
LPLRAGDHPDSARGRPAVRHDGAARASPLFSVRLEFERDDVASTTGRVPLAPVFKSAAPSCAQHNHGGGWSGSGSGHRVCLTSIVVWYDEFTVAASVDSFTSAAKKSCNRVFRDGISGIFDFPIDGRGSTVNAPLEHHVIHYFWRYGSTPLLSTRTNGSRGSNHSGLSGHQTDKLPVCSCLHNFLKICAHAYKKKKTLTYHYSRRR